MAPVIRALEESVAFEPVVISTGQHRELLHPLLKILEVRVRHNLDAMVPNQTLNDLNSTIVRLLGGLLSRERPALLLVHGDTATAFAGAVAAFYENVAVAHVEAGVRSGSLRTPFPEEFHRYAIARIATTHFASTRSAADNLVAEGVARAGIEVTGSTAVDGLEWVMDRQLGRSAFTAGARRNVLVTLHRRESQGQVIERVARGLATLAAPDVDVVFLLHRNPAVRASLLTVARQGGSARFLEPLDYPDFVRTLADSDVVLTDSGGVQEEGTALQKRVLVVRAITDRPEAVEAGNAEVIGLDPDEVVDRAVAELSTERPRPAAVCPTGPYGDGRSARRVVRRLSRNLVHE